MLIMAVRYVQIDGKRVSWELSLVLNAARADGVDFILNSGKRTLTEQRWLYNNQPPVAAYPDPDAPHILEGRWWHALDIDAVRGGAERFRKWCEQRGITFRYTVSGEPWHLQIVNPDRAKIIRLFSRADPYSLMPAKQRRLTKELVGIRNAARRRGEYTDLEKRRANSIKKYLGKVIRDLRDLSDRQLDKENRRERLELARDARAGRPIELGG